MEEAEQVSQLVGEIYDAALDRSLWPSVLESTCGYVQGLSAILGAEDSVQRSARFFFQWGNDPHFLKLYEETYYRLNPMTIPTVLHARVGSVLASSDLVAYEEIVASRFYREWLAPQGIVDAMAITLEKSATSYAAIAVHRHERQGRVDDDMRQRMAIVAPHFRRAVAIGKVVDLHRVDAAAFADTLDGITAGMFLVDAEANIVHANVRGETMLSEGEIFKKHGARFSAVDQQADQALRDVFAAADAGDDAVGSKGIAVPLTTALGERWIAHVLPLTSGARRRAGISYSAVAAVFVRKAALDLRSPLETLADVHKLTAAELRVLMAIVEVGGVPEVAPALGISETTVKTHLQRVFEKTGAKRQADLVKLVAGYMSPLGKSPTT
jgi:DNA-binding CsgD family transcriptional regulator